MRFIFYSPVAFFGKWDWRNSVEEGIGGSETSHVEMAWRLARRGHEVITYAPVNWESGSREWRGTTWAPLADADFTLPGTWVVYRSPESMDWFPKTDEQKVWLICQDYDYPGWTADRVRKIDRIVPLCRSHRDYLVGRHPELASKMWITSNGIKLDLVEDTEKLGIERNPFRIMYASSPDRGMLHLLKSFRIAREFVPELELHWFYGFNNFDKLIAQNPVLNKGFAKIREDILREAEQPGVVAHGRVSQPQLYQEWFKSGLWVYETNFNETSCITCMEAQAMGAIPIFSPVWALAENIKYGVAIPGDATNPLTRSRFAAEIVRMAVYPEMQPSIRREMMPEARRLYSWERWVDQWIEEAEIDMGVERCAVRA